MRVVVIVYVCVFACEAMIRIACVCVLGDMSSCLHLRVSTGLCFLKQIEVWVLCFLKVCFGGCLTVFVNMFCACLSSCSLMCVFV